jgi:endonuclease/exonuclease/phosphatase family metal-dependent hydrolase
MKIRGMRVLTFNVLGPSNPHWDRRRKVSAAVLRRLNPDIVALQEVPIGSTPTIIDEIDQRCPPHARALPWAATLLVHVDTPHGRVLVAHHKPSWQFGAECERELQAVAAARLIERHADRADHAVVLGDFDATPDAASMRFWRGRQSLHAFSVCYQDAWATVHPGEPGYTFTPANPLVRAGQRPAGVARRIDYILVRAGDHGPTLQVARCDTVLDRPVDGVWASDHFGVMADLVTPEHAPASWSSANQAER